MWSANRLPGPFGAQVVGLDLAKDQSSETMSRLGRLLYENRFLVIGGQAIDTATYLSFGRKWGAPIPLINPDGRNVEFPEITETTNAPDRQKSYAMHWHQDNSYDTVPSAITMLHCLEAPDEGGETLFVDCAAAYEALPAEVKARIEPLVVLHGLGRGKPLPEENIIDPRTTGQDLSRLTHFDTVRHPLVRRHPVTGEKAFYGLGGTSFGIEGMDEAEGQALLRELKLHAIAPQFRAQCKARQDDILMWDNLLVMHSATLIEHSDEPGKRRRLLRISVRGAPTFAVEAKALESHA